MPFVFCLLFAPILLNYETFQPAWDDTYFLHRAVCIHHAAANLDLSGINECLSILTKSPLMVFSTLPWGALGGTVSGVGLSFVTLALLSWILVILIYSLCRRAGISLQLVILAGAVVGLNEFVRGMAGSFLVDTPFGLIVAASCLLVPLEQQEGDPMGKSSLARGVLWGVVVSLGILAKITYLFFAAFLLPLIFILRWRKYGYRQAFAATAAALFVLLVPLLLFLRLFPNFLSHAVRSSFGAGSEFYASADTTLWSHMKNLGHAPGMAVVPLVILLFIVGIRMSREKSWFSWRLVPLFSLLCYALITLMSSNQDLRFASPVFIGLPFALAALPKPTAYSETSQHTYWPILFLVTIVSLPMFARLDLSQVRLADAVLQSLPTTTRTSIMLATDDPHFNIETFLLAQQLSPLKYSQFSIDTLVYDELRGLSLPKSIDRLAQVDFVVLHTPPLSMDPPWSNRFAADFRMYALAHGESQPVPLGAEVEIVKLRHVPH